MFFGLWTYFLIFPMLWKTAKKYCAFPEDTVGLVHSQRQNSQRLTWTGSSAAIFKPISANLRESRFINRVLNSIVEYLRVEWSNVERPILPNFKITNIKIAKNGLFDYFIYDFFYYYLYKLLENSKYLIIFPNDSIF